MVELSLIGARVNDRSIGTRAGMLAAIEIGEIVSLKEDWKINETVKNSVSKLFCWHVVRLETRRVWRIQLLCK